MQSIIGKRVSTRYGMALVIRFVEKKDKFQVEYVGKGAIGWLRFSELKVSE